ncbi:hypothetical protein BSKO_02603 [Bryopsis sp. KO-2023]|nr:hypothetical protein BSKO_02603 [Bryopsis sp. KO-2023]
MMNGLRLDLEVFKGATLTGGSVQGDDLHQFVLENDARAILNVRFTEDVHVPNGDGQFALVTAVRIGNLEIAKLLLAHRVAASIFEPVAKTNLLLQFGANPDIEDDDGNTARSVAPYCSEFLEILSEYDADGSMAFEDPPGTWSTCRAEYGGERSWEDPNECECWRECYLEGYGVPYYWSRVLGTSQWEKPPALLWCKGRISKGAVTTLVDGLKRLDLGFGEERVGGKMKI